LVLFGGFDGNYFNDIFYINLYNNRNQKIEKPSIKSLTFVDHGVYSFEDLKLSINTGFIGKYFEGEADIL
jgi:hypothetical protein